MRQHGIGHIVGAILDAPENATAVDDMNECARQARFKAGYNKCFNDVNPFYASNLPMRVQVSRCGYRSCF
ncbi:hypothetical protein HanHA300_Chr00c1087g0838691 [Helianthus annuus]|nr:hypothetical protein HanHA300_Chr00c1087g0838691 [Helianthus annuus]